MLNIHLPRQIKIVRLNNVPFTHSHDVEMSSSSPPRCIEFSKVCVTDCISSELRCFFCCTPCSWTFPVWSRMNLGLKPTACWRTSWNNSYFPFLLPLSKIVARLWLRENGPDKLKQIGSRPASPRTICQKNFSNWWPVYSNKEHTKAAADAWVR